MNSSALLLARSAHTARRNSLCPLAAYLTAGPVGSRGGVTLRAATDAAFWSTMKLSPTLLKARASTAGRAPTPPSTTVSATCSASPCYSCATGGALALGSLPAASVSVETRPPWPSRLFSTSAPGGEYESGDRAVDLAVPRSDYPGRPPTLSRATASVSATCSASPCYSCSTGGALALGSLPAASVSVGTRPPWPSRLFSTSASGGEHQSDDLGTLRPGDLGHLPAPTGASTDNDKSSEVTDDSRAKDDLTESYLPASVYARPYDRANLARCYFVNRYAEAFDLFATDLTPASKRPVALGYQLMGSGKSVLGAYAVSVLNRPREAPGVEEDAVAERLKRSLTLNAKSASARDALLARAKARPEDETLVARALREHLIANTAKSHIVDLAKNAVTIFIDLQKVRVSTFTSLEAAIANAIFKILDLTNPPASAADACEIVSAKKGGRQILLVFDEIGALVGPKYSKLFLDDPQADRQKAALQGLRDVIDEVRGTDLPCMVYLTGRTDWLAMEALAGPASPLRPAPVFLYPLHGSDVLELMQKVPDFRGSNNPEVQAYLAEAIAQRSGGVGRVVMGALDSLEALGLAKSKNDANEILRGLDAEILSKSTHLFPKATTDINDLKDSTLLSVVGHLLLFGKRFMESEKIELQRASGRKEILITSALTALGFNFAPAPEDPKMLVPVAGDWHLAMLQNAAINQDKKLMFTLIGALRAAGKGTEKGKHFETVCIHQAIQVVNASVEPGTRREMGEIFPFLRGTPAESATLGAKLRPRVLPKVTSIGKELTDSEIANKMVLVSRKTIRPSDLRWYLFEVLKVDEVGISQGESGSQDWFIRAEGAVVGFSNKNRKVLQRNHIVEELKKRPALSKGDEPYVLVNLAPILGPELKVSVGEHRSALLITEAELRDKKYSSDTSALSNTDVVRDIVIVSPTHKDGLSSLLTESVYKEVFNSASGDYLDQSHLMQILDLAKLD